MGEVKDCLKFMFVYFVAAVFVMASWWVLDPVTHVFVLAMFIVLCVVDSVRRVAESVRQKRIARQR